LNIVITNVAHYIDAPGGAPRLAWDEGRRLTEMGHRVTMLACATEDQTPEAEQVDGITLLRYKVPNYNAADPRRLSAHLRATEAVLLRHVREQVDAVHGHVPLPHLAACRLYGTCARTIYTIHSPVSVEMDVEWANDTMTQRIRRWVGLPLLKSIEGKCLKESSSIMCVSEFTRQEIMRIHGPQMGERIRVLPGWVNFERFRIIQDRTSVKAQLGWPTNVPVLFTLRRLVKRMGLDRLVTAAAMVRERGLSMHLVIGGSGPMGHELEQMVVQLGLSDRVQFAGRIPDEQLPLMYGACDAFVLPTAALECFGLITVEALVCGRPVLATPVGAIPEVLGQFEPKWLSESASEAEIAALLTRYLRGELPSHSAKELRDRAEELYSNKVRLEELCGVVVGRDENGEREN